LLVAFPIISSAQANVPFLNPELSTDQRVNDLVSRLTNEEKIAQMQDVAPAIPRLGIPAYNWWNEGLHGVARSGKATVFPQAIGLAATWDTALLHEVGETISTEARAKYNDAIAHKNTGRYYGLTFWSPNINIFRDPRWGRGQETYGEDPYLTANMGVAFITGLQGSDPRYLKVVATAKHYAVHSGPESLRHRFDAPITLHDLFDTYTPAFRAAVIDGHVDSIMCAYNSVQGEPACANTLLFDLLRNKWGFSGYVVSDCWAINDLYQGHSFVMTLDQAAALSLKAGTDLTCGPQYRVLERDLEDRLVSQQEIDRAVKRLFEARIRLGLLDPPQQVPWSGLNLSDVDTQKNRELALKAARESIVLLKNQHQTLPLKSSIRSIAVIGPTADSLGVLLGNYNGNPEQFTTILAGIRKQFSNSKVYYAPGAPLTETRPLPIPVAALRTSANSSQEGLRAEYFSNIDLSGSPGFTRTDRSVNFEWNNASPAPDFPKENYSARWTGALIAPAEGDYRIGTTSDGGCRLYLDDKLLIDDWVQHGVHTMTVLVHLKAGTTHSIKLEYFHKSWESTIRLVWMPPYLLRDALDLARKSDVIIATVGITAELEGEESESSDPGFFGGDRTDITLPMAQEEMLEALAAVGKPLIVVLTSGSAMAVNWANDHAAAILEAWYPGEEGGTAVADVLSGNYNPSGRLPITFYKSVAQLPPFTNYSMKGRTYRYFAEQPLYPFGYGLSFSSFAYSEAKVAPLDSAGEHGWIASVRVTNTSSIPADEVVQLYISHPDQEGAPLRALAGFQRVHLLGSASQTIDFKLSPREVSVVDNDGKRFVPAGPMVFWFGSGQPIPAIGEDPTPGVSAKVTQTTPVHLPD
jgi:beta-glucosidase